MFKAYDAKGKDTGKCIEGSTTLSEAGGYRLAKCKTNDPAQSFVFDPSGTGGPILQLIGADANSDGCGLYLALLYGAVHDDAWKVNTPIGRVSCRNSDAYTMAALPWRWSGGQVFSTYTNVPPIWCLTAASGDLRLGDCRQPATLTRWDVVVVK
jgi:hypothetical protein